VDEAFVPLSRLLEALFVIDAEFRDEAAGVHTYVTACEVESPIEVEVSFDADGLRLGSTPPLYPLQTTFAPAMHRVRMVIEGTRRGKR
jgi:hypothetical protein